MTYDTILYEASDRIATITLHRPETLNAINQRMIEEINEAYRRAEDDPEVWITIITGTGRAFCTGADVSKMPGTSDDTDPSALRSRPYLANFPAWDVPQEATPPYLQMAKPIICAVNGICCGAGLDFVTTSDIAIASDKATFFDPHVTIGIVSAHEMVRLARVLPLNVAMRLALMGRQERLSAARVYELGLISEVVPEDQLATRAREIAGLINLNAPLAVRGTRMAIRKGLSLPVYEAELLAEQYRLRVALSADSFEGPRAFMERRAPSWQAR
jgi:enoyl-CoA hydratase/carnithine racemase